MHTGKLDCGLPVAGGFRRAVRQAPAGRKADFRYRGGALLPTHFHRGPESGVARRSGGPTTSRLRGRQRLPATAGATRRPPPFAPPNSTAAVTRAVRAGRVLLSLVAVALVMGCDSSVRQISSAAPPTVVCGSTVSRSADGLAVVDIRLANGATVSEVSGNGGINVLVARGCSKGATVTIRPIDAYTITRQVKAKDGKPVFVLLFPRTAGPAVLTVHDGNHSYALRLALPASPTPR